MSLAEPRASPHAPTRVADALHGRVVAVLNTASGSYHAGAETEVEAIFAGAGVECADVVCAAPGEINLALGQAAASADVLAVLGGDGTIRSAAERCQGRDMFLIPLPGGTMNLLSRALYGGRAWREALIDTLASPTARDVSGGVAGQYPFFVAAILGAPTLWADAREALRAGHLLESAKRSVTALRRGMAEPLVYQFGEAARGSAKAVAVLCPLVSKALSDDELSLEAAAIAPPTATELFRLGVHAVFDDWRNDPDVSLSKVRWLRVTGHGRIPVILDGERVRMGRIVNIRFVPRAFRALTPGVQDMTGV